MKRWVAAAAIAALFVGMAAYGWAPSATAQGIDILTLRGPGSSIGVNVRDLTPEEADKAQAGSGGVFIETVRQGTPAEKAGLRSGDIVVEFDGERVRSVRQFTRLVQETPPRRSVDTVVLRNNARQTIAVVPEAMGEFGAFATDSLPRDLERRADALRENLRGNLAFRVDPGGLRGRLGGGRTLGVTVTPLTDQLADYFGVDEGALVTSVEADSPAAAAGLKAGDVITAVGGTRVRSAADVQAAIRGVALGEAMDISVTRDRKAMTVKATIPPPESRLGRRGLPV